MKYFDNAATTKISDNSLTALNKASEIFYNPSALYANSMDSKNIIEASRKFFLKKFHAPNGATVIFTGSASESNNSVLHSCITRKDKTYIFSAGEHSSIYETAKYYERNGFDVKFIPLNNNGSINSEELLKHIDGNVALVSVIHVSNETGAINNIKHLCKAVKSLNPNCIFHSDGVQAVGKFEIDLTELGVDYYTISAHKINGPKGIGALFIKNPSIFKPFILGGAQEMGLRAGTENLPQIAAFKTAVDNLSIIDFSSYKQAVLSKINADCIVVSDNDCVDNIISICFKGVRSETILHMLEEKGFLIGTGSACNSKAKFNRVLSEIVNKDYLPGAIRISFSSDVTIEDCFDLSKSLNEAVNTYKKRTR